MLSHLFIDEIKAGINWCFISRNEH